jgi:DNA-binding PadR family transcriptional regulator
MATTRMTTTSYSVLGLLSLGEWTAYELAGLMARSVGIVLSRAPSVVYEEPKRLVAMGFATARTEARGQRSVAVYAITAPGRAALAAWLAEPSAFPSLDAEAIVKTVFAGAGRAEDLRATVGQLRAQAAERLEALLVQNEGYLAAGDGARGPFPERLPLIALSGRFPLLYLRFLVEWATWAEEALAAWDALDDEGRQAWARASFEENRTHGKPRRRT